GRLWRGRRAVPPGHPAGPDATGGHYRPVLAESVPGAGVTGAEGPGQRGEQQRDRELVPLLGQVGDVVPGDDHLEDAAVDLPVAELRGARRVHAQVDDVQPVTKVVEHQARLAVIGPDGPRLPQRVEVVEAHLLAPDADR